MVGSLTEPIYPSREATQEPACASSATVGPDRPLPQVNNFNVGQRCQQQQQQRQHVCVCVRVCVCVGESGGLFLGM